MAELVQLHCTAPPPPLSEVRPELPERLVQGVQRAMSKDPAERFDSVIAFLGAIGGRRAPRPPQAPVPARVSEAVTERLAVMPPPARWPRIGSLVGAAGLGVVATLIVTVLYLTGGVVSGLRSAAKSIHPAKKK